MVEMWEIEWNSSMIQHGADMGTMEFIFAKGGTLRDFNYVLLNQNDDTWEPLIKAVAERDNSHPDIIRKQAEEQQPFFMQSGQQGAQQFMGTGVRSPREANRQFNTAQRMQNLANYHQNPSAMNAMRAGKYGAAMGRGIMESASAAKNFAQNTAMPAMQRAGAATKDFAQNTAMPAMRAGAGMVAAGAGMAGQGMRAAGQGIAATAGKARNYLSQKFPGVKQRMGQFMQGVKNVGRETADFARHGIDAYLGEKDATGKRQGGVRERNVMQQGNRNEMDRLTTSEQQKINREKQRATGLATPQLRANAAAEAQKRQEAIDARQKKLTADMKQRGPTTGFGGLREQVRRLSQKRKDANQPETALDPAIFDAASLVDEQMEEGPAEAAMADSTMPAGDEITEADLDLDTPTTEMPAPEAGAPQPVEEAPPMTRAQELAMNALRAAKYSGAESDPSKYRGSTKTQYGNVGGFDFDNMSYEDLQGKLGGSQKQKEMFNYLVNELGLSPAEAAKEVETTEVEVPDNDEITEDDLLLENRTLLSENKYEVKGWDALLKRLDVR